MYKQKFPYKKKRRSTPLRQNHVWSNYQNDIFADVSSGHGNTIVNSVPGSGKSSTIIEASFHVPPELQTGRQVLITAFNKLIVADLESKVLPGIEVSTSHKLGFRTVLKHWGAVYGLGRRSIDTESESIFNLAAKEIGMSLNTVKLQYSLVNAVSLCKAYLADEIEEIENVCIRHGIQTYEMNIEDFAWHVNNIINQTRDEPQILNGKSVITFDDMIWLPHAHGWLPEQFNWVLIDEAQDISNGRGELLLNAVKPGGRVLATGDNFQAIFSFAGAGLGSLDKLAKQLSAKRLPLSVCYRCPTSVVDLAKKYNNAIETRPNAHKGIAETVPGKNIYDHVEPGSVVLSRTNYPLVKAAFALLARGFKANIQGKDIGNRYWWRINKCWQPNSIEELKKSTDAWCSEVCERLEAKKYSTTSVKDEAKSIKAFTEGANSIGEVNERIKSFFSDNDAQVKLSTTHKFKGLERKKVILMRKTFRPERGGEEANIYYVALTRAKEHLVIADGVLPL